MHVGRKKAEKIDSKASIKMSKAIRDRQRITHCYAKLLRIPSESPVCILLCKTKLLASIKSIHAKTMLRIHPLLVAEKHAYLMYQSITSCSCFMFRYFQSLLTALNTCLPIHTLFVWGYTKFLFNIYIFHDICIQRTFCETTKQPDIFYIYNQRICKYLCTSRTAYRHFDAHFSCNFAFPYGSRICNL